MIYCLEGNGCRPSHYGDGWSMGGVCYTLNTIERHCVVYAIENHPNDSRVKLDDRGIVQTLNQRMGTGGGNVPMVIQEIISIDRAAFNQGENAKYDFSISGGGYTQTLVARGPNAICYRTDQTESERCAQRTTSGCNKNK